MAALPTTTTAFASGATEAQFKTFLTGQRDYLVGLFGADGTTATAKAALGVNDGVTSVNGSSGAISAAQVAAAATSGYGYTPANAANAATDHNHSSAYAPINSYGVAGETTILYYYAGSSISTGGTVAGSSLRRAKIGSGSGFTNTGVADTGTWKNLGEPVIAGLYGIFQRIA